MSMIGQSRLRSGHRARPRRTGFTLIELLVVMLIILLVSALVLPTVVPAIAHRQVSEAARILQAALAGARDVALNNNAPAGIRLLPDPVFNGISPVANPPFTTLPNQLDASRILASNRYVPIQLAPDYSEGRVRLDVAPPVSGFSAAGINPATYFPYPATSGGNYPATTSRMLYLEQEYFDLSITSSDVLNPPTSWYWNIRIGDRIQINNTGISYIIIGPMNVPNPDLFVNAETPGPPPGYPGPVPPLQRTSPHGTNYYPEFLFLMNGQDDDKDGYVDNGWDGVDNNAINGVDDLAEWTETETWQSSLLSSNASNLPYTITRRPVVAPGSRETLLPSNVVVDLTTWNPGAFGTSYVRERSRLPVDPHTGYVDILLNPNGTVVPTTLYSSPSSFGMDSAFYHFWLAERGDLFDPPQAGTAWTATYLLPMLANTPHYPNGNDTTQRTLKGERRLITLYTRTGQVVTNQLEDSSFDGNNPSLPFLLPQQGVRGDTR